jgi:signal recognition particle subunit SRP72
MQGGRDREAQGIYNSVLKNKPSDIGLVAVVSNNLLTLNKDQNIFDSKKKVKAATVEGLEHKLTSVHRAAIARNNALLAMYTNQVDLCKSLITELAKNFDNYNQEEQDLILAGVLSRSGKVSEAVELLLKGKKASRSQTSSNRSSSSP